MVSCPAPIPIETHKKYLDPSVLPQITAWLCSSAPAFEPHVTTGVTSRWVLAACPWHIQASPTSCPLRTQMPQPIPDTLLSQGAQPPKRDPSASVWPGRGVPLQQPSSSPTETDPTVPTHCECVGSEGAPGAQHTLRHSRARSRCTVTARCKQQCPPTPSRARCWVRG